MQDFYQKTDKEADVSEKGGYEIHGRMDTPLKKWMQAAGEDRVKQLAHQCGTTAAYLIQLSNAYRENPKVRLAIDLVVTIERMNRLALEDGVSLPPVRLNDLATPTRQIALTGSGRWTR